MNARLQRLIDALPGAGIDVMLVSNLVNVRYLSGYTGSNGLALIGPDTRWFLTDFRYLEQAATEVDPSFERGRSQRDLLEGISERLPGADLRMGFEDGHLTVRQHARLRDLLPDRVELVPAGPIVERLRRVKEPAEVAAIRAAAELADEALLRLLSRAVAGRTERALAIELDRHMLDLGAQRPGFETIIAAGANGALPHATPRDVEVRRGEMLVIDWGATLGGYCSDCTRTVAVSEPDPDAREVYELVLSAQLAGLGAVSPGAVARTVDAAARELIDAAGHGERFGHGLGHGVGLDIHEAPRLARDSEDELTSGNVITVEPGVYIPGAFGIRVEDLVVVTGEGCEILTSIPKELTVVG